MSDTQQHQKKEKADWGTGCKSKGFIYRRDFAASQQVPAQ
jgi:hypothetical protein